MLSPLKCKTSGAELLELMLVKYVGFL